MEAAAKQVDDMMRDYLVGAEERREVLNKLIHARNRADFFNAIVGDAARARAITPSSDASSSDTA